MLVVHQNRQPSVLFSPISLCTIGRISGSGLATLSLRSVLLDCKMLWEATNSTYGGISSTGTSWFIVDPDNQFSVMVFVLLYKSVFGRISVRDVVKFALRAGFI